MKLPRGLSPILSLSLVFTGLLFLFFAASAAPPPPGLKVESLTKTFEPSPTCVHENVIAKFMITIVNPDIHKEAVDKGIKEQKFTITFGEKGDGKINAITLETAGHEFITFRKPGSQKGLDMKLGPENEGVITGGDGSPVIVMVNVKGEFSKVGHKKIALAGEVQPKTAKEPAKGEGSVEGDVIEKITVTFNPQVIRTGFLIANGNAAPTPNPPTVVATVHPAIKARDVDFGTEGPGRHRVFIHSLQRNPDAGTITFRIDGLSSTPKEKPEGDTIVVPGDPKGCKTEGSAHAIVVIPAAIGPPHDQPNGAVQPFNLATDATTSPPAPAQLGLRPGQVALQTFYAQILTIRVNDQFGQRLADIYRGTPVSEVVGGTSFPINQKLAADGTYTDPVGLGLVRAVLPNNDPRVNQFLNGPPIPMPRNVPNQVQNFGVEIGDHALNPGIVNRVSISTPPNNIQIIWP